MTNMFKTTITIDVTVSIFDEAVIRRRLSRPSGATDNAGLEHGGPKTHGWTKTDWNLTGWKTTDCRSAF